MAANDLPWTGGIMKITLIEVDAPYNCPFQHADDIGVRRCKHPAKAIPERAKYDRVAVCSAHNPHDKVYGCLFPDDCPMDDVLPEEKE